MKRLTTFFIAATLFIAMSSSNFTANANGKLDQILNNMQQAARGIKTLFANMEQRKHHTQLGGKDEVYNGKLLFKHGGKGDDKVKITYTNGQEVSVNSKEIILYQPQAGQAIITSRQSLSSESQEFAFFSTPYSLTTAQLKSRYNVVHTGDEQVGGVATSVLELTPKVKSSVRKMKWWVAHNTWLPIKTEVTENNGDLSTFILSGMETNGGIADSAFKINFKPGTKTIRR